MRTLKRDIRYELFVSYAHRDNQGQFAGKVAALVDLIKTRYEEIVGKPLEVFFDEREITTGEDWRNLIYTGLVESRMMLAVISPNYFASRFCRLEWSEYTRTELEHALPGLGIRPVYVIRHPDFDTAGNSENVDRWLKDLARRQYFPWVDWWPKGQQELELAGIDREIAKLIDDVRVRVDLFEIRQNAPRNRGLRLPSPHFRGRREELRLLSECLSKHRVGVVTAIHGIGGMGKSQLAYAYAWGYGARYSGGRFLIDASPLTGTRDTLIRGLMKAVIELAPCLGLEITTEEIGRNFEGAYNRVAHCLQANPSAPVLFVLDNVDEERLLESDVLEHGLPTASHIHVIATTRLGSLANQNHEWIAVDALHPEDAEALLDSLFQIPDDQPEREAATAICRRLGNHPFAIETVGVYLRERNSSHRPRSFQQPLSFTEMLDWIDKEGISLVDDKIAPSLRGGLQGHSERLLGTLLERTFSQLSPMELFALQAASFFPPDFIAIDWVHALAAEEFKVAPGETRAPDPILEALAQLQSMRLMTLDTDDTTWPIARVHRIVHQTIASRMTEKESYRIGFAVYRWMGLAVSRLAEFTSVSDLPLLDCAAQYAIHHREGRYSEGAAMIAHLLGRPLSQHGNINEALILGRHAVTVWQAAEESNGDCEINLVESLLSLGDLEFRAGDFNESTKCYGDALNVMQEHMDLINRSPHHALMAAYCHSRLAMQWIEIPETEFEPGMKEKMFRLHQDQAEGLCGLSLELGMSQATDDWEEEKRKQMAGDLQIQMLLNRGRFFKRIAQWDEVALGAMKAVKLMIEPIPALRQRNPVGGLANGAALLLIEAQEHLPNRAEEIGAAACLLDMIAESELSRVGDTQGGLQSVIAAKRLKNLVVNLPRLDDSYSELEQSISELLNRLAKITSPEHATGFRGLLGY